MPIGVVPVKLRTKGPGVVPTKIVAPLANVVPCVWSTDANAVPIYAATTEKPFVPIYIIL